ncbi:MAG TPA: DUF952 domain-containing protein [Thermomicrobiales bacterium]|nr:DUF952 domain-containing protein [Thermomicrobiales bacterium]
MTIYRTAEEARNADVTYHMTPLEVWERQQYQQDYYPEAFPNDGFIHCTNGTDQLIWVANTFYTAERREIVVLALSVPAITSEVRYDDPEEKFPHIYGPLNPSAVIGKLRVVRAGDGGFLAIEE